MKTYAVFGAAFDPFHRGHVDAVKQALEKFDQVLLVPSAAHAFGKQMTPYAQRLELLRAGIDEMLAGERRVRVADIEPDIKASRPSQEAVYSIDVLQMLADRARQTKQEVRYVLLLGPDNAVPETWKRFHRHEEIERGFGVGIVTERLHIHSSDIREFIARHAGEVATLRAKLPPLVGERITELILEHGMYGSAGAPRKRAARP